MSALSVMWPWAELLTRWTHLIAGIAWIGSSFYFIALDTGLRRRGDLIEGVVGEAWQVHGGGFYSIQKYAVAPARMPEELTWFKWEAYATWLSGMVLLGLVYYAGAELYLIDRTVADLSPLAAVAIGAGSLALGWVVYHRLCRSPVGRHPVVLGVLVYLFIVAVAAAYGHVFSGRGAFVHVGALIGTMMVANVAHVIIPNQRKVVADLIAGKQPDPALGAEAKQRSVHNTYLTLPVLFLMISNHYPMTFKPGIGWIMVALALPAGAAVRQFFVARHKGENHWWLWVPAAAALVIAVWLAQPRPAPAGLAASFDDVAPIIAMRCAVCHAAKPTFEGFDEAPKGVRFETRADIEARAALIGAQAVDSDTMPPGNVTGITDAERALIGAWAARVGGGS